MIAPEWSAVEGSPVPLGVTYIPHEQAYNFALYSKYATGVTLLLYSADDPLYPIDTEPFRFPHNKTGRVWHCRLPASRLEPVRYYAYRVYGPQDPRSGQRFDPEKIVLDPYAKAVYFPPNHSRLAAIGPGSNAGRAPLGILQEAAPFDFDGDTCPRHGHDTIIYEMHVKGLTARENSGVAAAKRGTFAGVIEKIPYLLELGVTAVELMPVFQFDPDENNYWGYMPLNFFSPHHAYASDPTPGGQFDEFRRMVKALHEAGIEVLLDVVYNHTTENDASGPTYSFRAIDNTSYYLLESDPSRYRNDAGTGNVLHCANRAVRKMILDSMRFWAEQMHVDGFRFDLAAIFTRNDDGSINLDDPPVIGAISSDPIFEDVRLIAEAWDLGTYQLGRYFPGMTWLQWNGKFRDDVRRFVKSDNGMVGALMQRMYGSDDLFPQDLELGYRPFQSINYICSHDGFSLYDLVSYQQKRNLANGNHNADGTDDNFNWNCGWEGDDNVPPEVKALRERQVKNFCALLMLANGTPMFLMGDEFMNTQQGNNNPYNQDNEISWLDWDLREKNAGVFRFFQRMIAFRKAHPAIASSTFWNGGVRWFDIGTHSVGWVIDDVQVMVNAYWEPVEFTVQGEGWRRVVDTSRPSPDDFADAPALVGSRYSAGPRSVVVLAS